MTIGKTMRKLFVAVALVGVALGTQKSATASHPDPPSGMLLGVYAFANWQGLRLTGTIPGYSADGRLFRDDVLLRVSDGVNVYPVRTLSQIEYAKDRIGPNQQAAIEFVRPGAGRLYAWVEFRPVGGMAAYMREGSAPVRARFQTEAERPGARQFFHGSGRVQPQPSTGGRTLRPSGGSNSPDPSSFFRGR